MFFLFPLMNFMLLLAMYRPDVSFEASSMFKYSTCRMSATHNESNIIERNVE